jgi:hypothetical protein
MTLPSFPEGTRFVVVRGIPVSRTFDNLGHPQAWDVPGGRDFPLDPYLRNGIEISEARFRELVSQRLALETA